MIKKILAIFLISILTSNSSIAWEVTWIDRETKAPFSGYLFPEDKAKELRNSLIELDGLKSINESLNRSIKLQTDIIDQTEKKVILLQDQNTNLMKELNSQQSLNEWQKVLWFVIGIGVTGLTFYGIKQISR